MTGVQTCALPIFTGKAASMGEGVVAGVLDALIADFTTRLGDI